MKNKTLTAGIMAGLVVLVALPLVLLQVSAPITGQVIAEPLPVSTFSSEQVALSFTDTTTNCPLSGNLYINDDYFGPVESGKIEVESIPKGALITIEGKTDTCFKEDANLSFVQSWTLTNADYYYFVNASVLFNSTIQPHRPATVEAMQQFVRPEEARPALARVAVSNNKSMSENLDAIAKYPIAYLGDSIIHQTYEYWQTPRQTLMHKTGDCEDWALTILSMMRAHYPAIQCYAAVWSSHVSIFCNINNNFVMYDQGDIKKTVSLTPNPTHDAVLAQENERTARFFLKSYFSDYGIKSDQRSLQVLFNDKEKIEFSSTDDFVNWMLEQSNAL